MSGGISPVKKSKEKKKSPICISLTIVQNT